MKNKMTVEAMIKELQKFDPKMEIVIWEDQYLKYPATFNQRKVVYCGNEPYLFRQEDGERWYKNNKKGVALLID